MNAREWEGLLQVLIEANPKSIFCEVAFLEAYVESCEKRLVGVPLAMFEEALPFLEDEFRWKPRMGGNALTHPAWWRVAAAFALFGTLAAGQVR